MAKTKELQELGKWKVGQKVLITGSGGSGGYEAVRPITRITDGRGGTIYVDIKPQIAHSITYVPHELSFDEHGSERGGDTWSRKHIDIATEADTIRIKGKNAMKRLACVEWQNLTPEKALEIEKLLNDNGVTTK